MKSPLAVMALLALAVTGCGNTQVTATTVPAPRAPATPAINAGGVPWADYAATLQGQIDSLAAAKNCAELQKQFDTADANNAATQSRTGHNNASLMGYIDAKIKAAGCY